MTWQSGVFFIIGLLLTLASLGGSGWMLSTKEDTTQSYDSTYHNIEFS